METRYIKIVLVKYFHSDSHFPFQVPDKYGLNIGDLVLCNTNVLNNQVGVCVTPSFRVSDTQLETLYNVNVRTIKPIQGFLKPVVFGKDIPDGNGDLEVKA